MNPIPPALPQPLATTDAVTFPLVVLLQQVTDWDHKVCSPPQTRRGTSRHAGAGGAGGGCLFFRSGLLSLPWAISCAPQADVLGDRVPHCPVCGGIRKPDIVFFGEPLPDRFLLHVVDFPMADLLLILGTSLQVCGQAIGGGGVCSVCRKLEGEAWGSGAGAPWGLPVEDEWIQLVGRRRSKPGSSWTENGGCWALEVLSLWGREVGRAMAPLRSQSSCLLEQW